MPTLITKHQRLAALRPLSPESVTSLAVAWDVRMVHESNAIEGNSLTLRETNDVLLNPKATIASGKPIKDYQEAIDLGNAWRITKAEATFGARLTEPTLLKIYGAFRNCKTHTFLGSILRSGASRIHQLHGSQESPFEEPEYLGEIFLGIECIENPVEVAARMHERVRKHSRFDEHPGRAARLAMNFILLAAGFPPVSIPMDLRMDYYNALEAADSGDFQAWLGFLTEQLDKELDEWLSALEPSPSSP